ncbi:hypothetical protein L596_000920 [Steinernema carpocapsae]|uniref:Uncharacterized protein n=1 Tax=Steinernema carpocapsae TaxID=34508 RepID=A0A4U8UK34_STECR|nr:hypothetical protein L596_000920 [Steinernema carpocapsae]
METDALLSDTSMQFQPSDSPSQVLLYSKDDQISAAQETEQLFSATHDDNIQKVCHNDNLPKSAPTSMSHKFKKAFAVVEMESDTQPLLSEPLPKITQNNLKSREMMVGKMVTYEIAHEHSDAFHSPENSNIESLLPDTEDDVEPPVAVVPEAYDGVVYYLPNGELYTYEGSNETIYEDVDAGTPSTDVHTCWIFVAVLLTLVSTVMSVQMIYGCFFGKFHLPHRKHD